MPAPADQDRGPTIHEAMLAYLNHASVYYRKHDKPTSQQQQIRDALKPLKRLYGSTSAAEFGPLKLRALREDLIATGLARSTVNSRVGIIKRLFSWAVEHELVSPSTYHGLSCVKGLRRGRSPARETEKVKPVAQEYVDAVVLCVSPQVAAMIRLQTMTGMRPGEVVIMRTCDINVSGEVWIFRPEYHKTEHHGADREVYLGKRAQEVLRPWFRPDLQAYLFSPAEAESARNAERRRNRKTPMTPSQSKRRPRRIRRHPPGNRYDVAAYRRAIRRACIQAFGADDNGKPELVWHPHQLRHSYATWARKQFGIEIARIMLGQRTMAAAEIYAERDQQAAMQIAAKVG